MKMLPALLLSIAFTPLAWAQQAPSQEATTVPHTNVAVSGTDSSTKISGSSVDAMSGVAAYYSNKFQGRRTVSGQRYNKNAMTAAHPSLPMGTRVKVTNLKNNRSAVVVINDRLSAQSGRIIDVTRRAAVQLGLLRSGVADVTLQVLGHFKSKHKRVARKHRM